MSTGIQAAIAAVAALVASAFAVELALAYRRRPRPHVLAWTAAMTMYALATWALFLGVAVGWSGPLFRVFYLLGAIVNVPFLALGSAYLVLAPSTARRLAWLFVAFAVVSTVVVFATPFSADLPAEGVPAGSDVFPFLGPRLLAVIGNAVGTLLLVWLAGLSAVRFWRPMRRLAVGNLLIVAGTLSPAFGGTLTGLGDAGGLGASLLLGAALLWAGYRVATSARSSAPSPDAPSAPTSTAS